MLKLLPETLRGLLKAPATRPHPARRREPVPGARGQLANDMDQCILCGSCVRACPSGCLGVDKGAGTWTWDPMACVFCGSCVDICPTGSLSQTEAWREPGPERQSVTLRGTPGGKAKPGKGKGGDPER